MMNLSKSLKIQTVSLTDDTNTSAEYTLTSRNPETRPPTEFFEYHDETSVATTTPVKDPTSLQQ